MSYLTCIIRLPLSFRYMHVGIKTFGIKAYHWQECNMKTCRQRRYVNFFWSWLLSMTQLGPGQSGPWQLGPGQLRPGAQLSAKGPPICLEPRDWRRIQGTLFLFFGLLSSNIVHIQILFFVMKFDFSYCFVFNSFNIISFYKCKYLLRFKMWKNCNKKSQMKTAP